MADQAKLQRDTKALLAFAPVAIEWLTNTFIVDARVGDLMVPSKFNRQERLALHRRQHENQTLLLDEAIEQLPEPHREVWTVLKECAGIAIGDMPEGNGTFFEDSDEGSSEDDGDEDHSSWEVHDQPRVLFVWLQDVFDYNSHDEGYVARHMGIWSAEDFRTRAEALADLKLLLGVFADVQDCFLQHGPLPNQERRKTLGFADLSIDQAMSNLRAEADVHASNSPSWNELTTAVLAIAFEYYLHPGYGALHTIDNTTTSVFETEAHGLEQYWAEYAAGRVWSVTLSRRDGDPESRRKRAQQLRRGFTGREAVVAYKRRPGASKW